MPCSGGAHDLALCGVVSTIEAFHIRSASRGAPTSSANWVREALVFEGMLERGEGVSGCFCLCEGIDEAFCPSGAASSFLVIDKNREARRVLSDADGGVHSRLVS